MQLMLQCNRSPAHSQPEGIGKTCEIRLSKFIGVDSFWQSAVAAGHGLAFYDCIV
jgi:hypothetical protein